MAEYIEQQAAIDLFYPVDPENDGSDGCTVVYKTENYTSDEIEAVEMVLKRMEEIYK